MNIEDPHWEEYESRFRALSEQLADNFRLKKGPKPEIASAELMLFLYGENGLSPEQELEALGKLEARAAEVEGTEILTAYWEDVALYLPA